MASTNFVDFTTPIVAAWLNDINGFFYSLFAGATTPAQARAAIGVTGTSNPSFSGDVTITGAGSRIRGDFTTTFFPDRTIFQSYVANGISGIYAIPNGTATRADFTAWNKSTPTDASFVQIAVDSTKAVLTAGAVGTGVQQALYINVNGTDRVRINTDGSFTVGAVTPTVSTFCGELASYAAATSGAAFVMKPQATGANGVILDTSFASGGYGPLIFNTSGVERVRFLANGQVGIGTAVPENGSVLHMRRDDLTGPALCVIHNASSGGAFSTAGYIARSSGAIGALYAWGTGSTRANEVWVSSQANHPLVLATNDAAKVRITAPGEVLINVASALYEPGTVGKTHISAAGLGQLGLHNLNQPYTNFWKVGPGGDHSLLVINQANVGVFLATGNTAWTANSDERLKDIIEPITDATAKVSSLRAVIGKFKTDEEDKRRVFLIAQDVQAVLPEAICENGDGFLGLTYTDIIPLLVAAVKELSERVAVLEAK